MQVTSKATQSRQDTAATSAQGSPAYVPYNERFTNIAGFDIKVKATVADLARKIDNHNRSRGFTNLLAIGDSGSGKTTFYQNLKHELHLRHPFNMRHFKEHQILNITQILKQLPKKQDYILGFDDVSFLVKKGKMKEDQLMDMFHELTKVRHTVQGRVVAIFIIHYPYAIEKFMRQAGYRVLTSITDDEREIYIKLFGPQSRRIIEQFIIDDRYQTEESQFRLPDRRGNFVNFTPKEPFKLALASRMGDLTFMVYQRIDCKLCAEAQDDEDFDRKWIESQVQKYGLRRVMRVGAWYGYTQTGVSILDAKDRALYNAWQQYSQRNNVDYKGLVSVLKEVKAYKWQKGEDKPSKQEIDLFLTQKLNELQAHMKAAAKGEIMPENELVKDQEKEPAEVDDADEQDEADDDFESAIFKKFGTNQQDDEGEDQE